MGIEYGQMNGVISDVAFSVEHEFEFPTVYKTQGKFGDLEIEEAKLALLEREREVLHQTRSQWFSLASLQYQKRQVQEQVELLRTMMQEIQKDTSDELEQMALDASLLEMENTLQRLDTAVFLEEKNLRKLMGVASNTPIDAKLELYTPPEMTGAMIEHPIMKLAQQDIARAELEYRASKDALLPSIAVGYGNQSMIEGFEIDGRVSGPYDRLHAVGVGFSVPLFFRSYKVNIQNSAINLAETKEGIGGLEQELEQRKTELEQDLGRWKKDVDHCQKEVLPRSQKIRELSTQKWEAKELGTFERMEYIEMAWEQEVSCANILVETNQKLSEFQLWLGQ